MTHLTVSGTSIESEFAIFVRIEMEPYSAIFGSSNESGEDCIPIIIRSRKDGNHIHDMMELQQQELRDLQTVVQDMYSFIEKPFILAACNVNQA